METVLPLSDINFDPSKVTDINDLTAEEFLLYVRYEAEQCPQVVRATVDSSLYEGQQTEYMPKVNTIPACDERFLPSLDWENELIDTFSRFRQHLSELSKDISTRERKQLVPSMKDESAWFRFCLGGSLSAVDGADEEKNTLKTKVEDLLEDDIDLRKNMLLASLVDAQKESDDNVEYLNIESEEGEVIEKISEVEYESAVKPSNQLLLQFDQVLTQRLLGFLASWLQFPFFQNWCREFDCSGKAENDLCPACENIFLWLFSLLSRLEKPLYMDAAATVRDIYRRLCIQRADMIENFLSERGHECIEGGVGPSKRTRDSSEDVNELPERIQKALALQNTLIVICGKYFGQEEASEAFDNNHIYESCRTDACAGFQSPSGIPFEPTDDVYKLDGDY